MKKIVAISLSMFALAGATEAFAATTQVCTGNASVTAASTVAAGTPVKFIQQGFNFRCSNNVFLSYDETPVALVAAASSRKGKNAYAGNTNGGNVTQYSTCTGTGQICDGSEVSTAVSTVVATLPSS